MADTLKWIAVVAVMSLGVVTLIVVGSIAWALAHENRNDAAAATAPFFEELRESQLRCSVCHKPAERLCCAVPYCQSCYPGKDK